MVRPMPHASCLWAMPYDLWHMAYGFWLMIHGLLLVAYGLWPMAYGLWSMAYGLGLVDICWISQDVFGLRLAWRLSPTSRVSLRLGLNFSLEA